MFDGVLKMASGFQFIIQFTNALWLLNKTAKVEYDTTLFRFYGYTLKGHKVYVCLGEKFFLHLLVQKQRHF